MSYDAGASGAGIRFRHSFLLRAGLLLAGGLLLMGLLPSRVALAQAEASRPAAERFRSGRSAFEAERYAEAADHFRAAATQESSGMLDAAHGSAWWWLGRAHQARGDSAKAHAAWRSGVNALDAADTLGVRLTDAYLRSVVDRKEKREARVASDLYLRLIGRAGAELPAAAREVLVRRVAEVLLLVPESKRAKVTPSPGAFRRGGGEMEPGAGAWLRSWWHRQDPRPATAANERVLEHLRRVEKARRRWPDEQRPAGYDVRGRVYVRLGPPSAIEHLESKTLDRDVTASARGFTSLRGKVLRTRENELWIYEALGENAQYLFANRGGSYKEATVSDLLPNALRVQIPNQKGRANVRFSGQGGDSNGGLAGSGGQSLIDSEDESLRKRSIGPGGSRGVVALKALRDFYRQMATYQPDYAQALTKIENYLGKAGNPIAVKRDPTFTSPPETAQRRIQEEISISQRLELERGKEVPTARTKAVDTSLPLAARTARFLTEAGSTRTEIYAGIDAEALSLPDDKRLRLASRGLLEPDRYLLRLTSVRYGPGYGSRRVARAAQRVEADRQGPVVYSLALPEVTGRYHLAVECDQYALSESGPEFVRSGVHRSDSLRALPSDRGRLVLSDLVPLRGERLAEVDRVQDEGGFALAPYPYDRVGPEAELAFYVEAYHLRYGSDDRTRYTVEYEVLRREEGGNWFGGDDEEVTAQSSTYEGTSRTAREFVTVDFGAYEEASRVRLSVRIIDEVSGKSAERTVTFKVQ